MRRSFVFFEELFLFFCFESKKRKAKSVLRGIFSFVGRKKKKEGVYAISCAKQFIIISFLLYVFIFFVFLIVFSLVRFFLVIFLVLAFFFRKKDTCSFLFKKKIPGFSLFIKKIPGFSSFQKKGAWFFLP